MAANRAAVRPGVVSRSTDERFAADAGGVRRGVHGLALGQWTGASGRENRQRLAGIAPPALAVNVIVQGVAFLYARLHDRQPVRLLGAVGFYLGAVIAVLVLVLFK